MAKNENELKDKAHQAIETIVDILKEKKLRIAPQKTELVIRADGKTVKSIKINVQDTVIESQESVKHLGVHLDRNFRMGQHIRKTAEKANKQRLMKY